MDHMKPLRVMKQEIEDLRQSLNSLGDRNIHDINDVRDSIQNLATILIEHMAELDNRNQVLIDSLIKQLDERYGISRES